MNQYIIEVATHEWGTRTREYRIRASNEATAAARALRMFKAEKVAGKHRIRSWAIKITKT